MAELMYVKFINRLSRNRLLSLVFFTAPLCTKRENCPRYSWVNSDPVPLAVIHAYRRRIFYTLFGVPSPLAAKKLCPKRLCNEPYTLLSKEIENIRNYVGLEQSRFRERLDISLSFTGDIDNKTIAPLLLLPFVENSIKHGIGEQLDKSWVNLHLHCRGK